MSVTFTVPETGKIKKNSVIRRKTALSVLISGLCYAAVPAWADCTVSNTSNANGGVDMTCEGIGITQNISQLGDSNNNNVMVGGGGHNCE